MSDRAFTSKQKLAELEREIAFRRQVYGRMVELGSMKQSDADYRIGVMEAIAADYRPPKPDETPASEP